MIPLRVLIGCWAALLGLTWLTVTASEWEVGGLGVWLALTIAGTKAVLVALYFMHLRWDKAFHSIVFVGSTLFVALFISLTLLDTQESAASLIAGYAPEIHGEGDAAERGRELYEATCIACHGTDAQGKKELNAPALHLQEDWYIASQLEKFRKGIRGGDIRDITGMQMRPMAEALPDSQAIADLAAYVSGMTGPPPVNELAGDPVMGKTFYLVCAACHGDDARGKSDLKSPALVGQNDWYLVAQLGKFKEGIRGAHPEDLTGAQMRPMALTLPTEQAIHDVVAYIGTLGARKVAAVGGE